MAGNGFPLTFPYNKQDTSQWINKEQEYQDFGFLMEPSCQMEIK